MRKKRLKLALLRKTAGLTQADLAVHLCVDRLTVVGWESGRYTPHPSKIPVLAKTLKVRSRDIAEAIFGSDAA